MSDEFEEVDRFIASLSLDASPKHEAKVATSQTIVFDRQGDLRLQVGSQGQTFLVDSRSLGRASPVWKAMIDGEWLEAKSTADDAWVAYLPDDNPQVMSVLLGIIHGDFPRDANLYSTNDIFAVASLADKYDIVHLLRPWAIMWIRTVKTRYSTGSFQSCIVKMCIAWDLGDEDLFESMAQKVSMQVEVDNEGVLLDPKGNVLKDDPLLSRMGIIDALANKRNELIEAVLRPLDEVLQRYLDGQDDACVAKKATPSESSPSILAEALEEDNLRSDCSMVLLGSLVRGLVDLYLFPVPESGDIFESAESLEVRVTRLLTRIKPLGKWSDSPHHQCNQFPGIATAMKAAIKRKISETMVDVSQSNHLARQAEKSGCSFGKSPSGSASRATTPNEAAP